jgi:hypothetical protein
VKKWIAVAFAALLASAPAAQAMTIGAIEGNVSIIRNGATIAAQAGMSISSSDTLVLSGANTKVTVKETDACQKTFTPANGGVVTNIKPSLSCEAGQQAKAAGTNFTPVVIGTAVAAAIATTIVVIKNKDDKNSAAPVSP